MRKVSVLVGIVTRDRVSILPKAISSVLSQRGPACRVAVLDDGSTDATPQLRTRFPEVQWIRWDTNAGYMAARNHLMKSTADDYFVSLDDDAWFLQGDEIALAVNYLEENKSSVAAVAFDILSPDRPRPIARGNPQPTATFIGCGHVVRLAAVREVGDYAASPGSYGGEEKDLCLRLLDAGYSIVKLPGVHVWHDKTSVARAAPQQHRSGVCNDLAMTLRRVPGMLLPAALAAKVYRHFRFSWQNGLTRPCLEGFALFLRSVPAVWHSRKPVRTQALRTFIRLTRS
jgi:GT2 family glycosyltransferase